MGQERRLLRRTAVWLGVAVLLAGCAATATPDVVDSAGFWRGLWQGLILPVTFVVSLFNDDVGIYQVRNTGHLYDLGFVLGAGGLSAPGFLSRGRGKKG